MSAQTFVTLREYFAMIWRFFSEIYIPGTQVTPAGLVFLVLTVLLVIRFLKRIFNLHFGGD